MYHFQRSDYQSNSLYILYICLELTGKGEASQPCVEVRLVWGRLCLVGFDPHHWRGEPRPTGFRSLSAPSSPHRDPSSWVIETNPNSRYDVREQGSNVGPQYWASRWGKSHSVHLVWGKTWFVFLQHFSSWRFWRLVVGPVIPATMRRVRVPLPPPKPYMPLAQSHPPVARQGAKKRRVPVVDVFKRSPIAACPQASNSAVCRSLATRNAHKTCVSLTLHQTSGSGENGKSSVPKRAVCAPNPIWVYALGRPSGLANVQ